MFIFNKIIYIYLFYALINNYYFFLNSCCWCKKNIAGIIQKKNKMVVQPVMWNSLISPFYKIFYKFDQVQHTR